jgi:hypothetical protein
MASNTRAFLILSGQCFAATTLMGFLVVPPPAHAAPCSQWGFNGQTTFQQSDGWQLRFTSTGSSAQGPAQALDGHFPDTGQPKHGNITGGVVNGQGIDISVHWDNGTVSKYSGEVDAKGGVTGNIYVPAQDPSVTGKDVASYTASGLKCITFAAPPAPPGPQVVPVPGAKDPLPHPLPPQTSPGQGAARLGVSVNGPTTLPAGASRTYTVNLSNPGDVSAPVELFISFGGNLQQIGQVTPSGGFNCDVQNHAGGTTSVHCTVGQLQSKATATITVQGRGSAPGAAHLGVNINSSDAAAQFVQKSQQLSITIT